MQLPAIYIRSLQEMEKKFHEQFFSPDASETLADLWRLWQMQDESVEAYLNRFKIVRNKCNSGVSVKEMVHLDVGSLKPCLR